MIDTPNDMPSELKQAEKSLMVERKKNNQTNNILVKSEIDSDMLLCCFYICILSDKKLTGKF